jgi:hypothetical protein
LIGCNQPNTTGQGAAASGKRANTRLAIGMDYAEAKRVVRATGHQVERAQLAVIVRKGERYFSVEKPDEDWLLLVWSKEAATPRKVTDLRVWKDVSRPKGERTYIPVRSVDLRDWSYKRQ